MLCVDIETRSLAPIKDVGAWAYSMHPSTDVLCLCATDMDTSESRTLDFMAGVSEEDIAWVNSHDTMLAHNYTFEEAIFWNQLIWKGFIPPVKWIDTMDICAYMGVPLSLEKAAEFLFHDEEIIRKDKEGKKIMQKICNPFKGSFREIKPDDYEKLLNYCQTDVDVTVEIFDSFKWQIPPGEWQIMEETHQMNRRGIPIKMELIDRLIEVYEQAVEEIDLDKHGLQTSDLNRSGFMPQWLMQRFLIEVKDFTKATIDELLAKDIPDDMREILEARQIMGASSVKKLYKAKGLCAGEGVVRNSFQYHGAKTGRFAGRGVQPQNLPRGFKKDSDIYDALKDLGL